MAWTLSAWDSRSDPLRIEQIGCLGFIGDFTVQLYGEHNEPLKGSHIKQPGFPMESKGPRVFLEHGSLLRGLHLA